MLKTKRKISDLERDEIHRSRPLMNYTSYNDSWFRIPVSDRFAGTWQWGQGPYYEWCDENCTDYYNIVKYDRTEIWGRFRSEKDAMLFKLKWA